MSSILCDEVYKNLLYQQLWTEVEVKRYGEVDIVCGKPSHRLTNDDADDEDMLLEGKEYVYPLQMHQYKGSGLTIEVLGRLFSQLPEKLKRLTLGIVNDDGTIVYYFVYKGVRKPKKN
ncbi:tRNA-splicing endonuclease subunit SEN15 [Kluyveromyces marxianus]|uniref:tRNA-splicing endonuclease subunit SEN15 n=2 Tax=Kluyveromyces marxianus TaxID=4911 RepID=W0TDQ5_KLUMD|nr:tRNA-splicing endonuclease subunit SEN15 [Kluyveromyces marxianus DMKU3-1042]QGN17377.1 tRNA-splicing endonuclease subunit SEN15 [Kluyveromyces marxianus]BAO41475.1 tRNA-splicing endonuclease subunit SEN15 [Kluyveromyces marxianus DMKU3-1042]BAP72923.1 tRNA-splicing endonuclease subunit SEN15 [Kluyveromyces marxianus]